MTLITKKLKAKIGDFLIKITLHLYKASEKNIIGKCIYHLYRFVLSTCNMNVLPIVNAEIYSSKTNNITLTLIEKDREGISANPIMANNIEETYFKSYKLPDIYLKKINNVCISGNSDIIIDTKNEYIINEKAYNTDPKEVIIDGLLFRTSKNIALIRDSLKHNKQEIDSGIMISGKFCNNYYHVMYENLIRLMYIEEANIPTNVPIIVDKKTLSIPSCKKIFDILTRDIEREVISIDSNIIYHFKELYQIDHINKLPSHSKKIFDTPMVLYSYNAIINLREKLINHKSRENFYKRIFISRKNTSRRKYNEDEVYNILKKYDFVRVSPEKYCFEDQISLFNNAEFIVTGSGAALSNLLFVKKDAVVICFGRSSYNERHEIPIFNTIANINGGKFYYFPRKSKVKDIHSDFEIDSNDLEKIIIKFLE